MTTSLSALLEAAPSGRPRPLLLDHGDYATAVIRQGQPVPWHDLAALTGHQGQVHALLDPDATWLDVGAFYAAHLDAHPDLVDTMGERTRTGYALRTLLADQDAIDALVRTGRTLAQAAHRPLVVRLPAPGRWLARAHAIAGTPLAEVDADRADTASLYIAEWLGKLGDLAVGLVLLDARAEAGDPDDMAAEVLGDYSALRNIVGHFEWSLALRDDTGVQVPDGVDAIGVLPEAFWLSEVADESVVPEGAAVLATIPAAARPEVVLDRLALLGSGGR